MRIRIASSGRVVAKSEVGRVAKLRKVQKFPIASIVGAIKRLTHISPLACLLVIVLIASLNVVKCVAGPRGFGLGVKNENAEVGGVGFPENIVISDRPKVIQNEISSIDGVVVVKNVVVALKLGSGGSSSMGWDFLKRPYESSLRGNVGSGPLFEFLDFGIGRTGNGAQRVHVSL